MSEETPSTESRYLTPAEWEQIIVLWESGSVTLQQLADRFGVNKSSISQGLKKKGAVRARRAGEYAKSAEESLKSAAVRKAEEIGKFKTRYHTYGDFIMQMAVQELQALNAIKREDRSKEENARVMTKIKYAAEIFGLIRDGKFHLFDLYNEQDQESDLPEIAVTQYSADEIQAIQDRLAAPLLGEDDPIFEDARAALADVEDAGEP